MTHVAVLRYLRTCSDMIHVLRFELVVGCIPFPIVDMIVSLVATRV